MSFEKLSAADERKVLKLIEKAVYYTRTGENPTDAMCKAASDVSVQPELLKRACEAFNKSKSIHMLSKTASDQRANSFDLVNGEQVFDRMYKQAAAPTKKEKGESLNLPSSDFTDLDMPFFKSAGMTKEASILGMGGPSNLKVAKGETWKDYLKRIRAKGYDVDSSGGKPVLVAVYGGDRDNAVTIGDVDVSGSIRKQADTLTNDSMEIRRTLQTARNNEYILKKSASVLKQTRLESELAIDKAVDIMYNKSEGELHKMARLLINKYGSDGENMVKILSAKLHRELPLEKTASYAVFPFTEPYISLVKAMDRAQEYRDLKKNFIDKTAAMIDMPVQAAVTGSNILKNYAEPMMDVAKVPMIEYLTKEKDSGSKGLSEVLTPEIRNKLKSIDASQNFIDVAADPYLKGYSINQIAEAYNNVTGTMPELQKPRYKGWLSSLVRKHLVQGNTFDPNEISNLTAAAKSISQAEMAKHDIASNTIETQKELAKRPKQVSSTLGSVVAGLGKGGTGGGSVGSIVSGSLKDLLPDVAAEKEGKPGKPEARKFTKSIKSVAEMPISERERAFNDGLILKTDPVTKAPYTDFAKAEKDTGSWKIGDRAKLEERAKEIEELYAP